jgi:putative nonproteinogenic amino acid hydroxylase
MGAMRSRLLGQVELDASRVATDAETIARFAPRDAYREYAFGSWRSYVLANGSGEEDDTTFRPYDGELRATALGRDVAYLLSLVEQAFHRERLRWVRAFVQEEGVLVAHRDFLELREPSTRINIPLVTHPSCLHSEGDDVYHMRAGEIWSPDSTAVHAAGSLEGRRRVALCLDFEGSSYPPELVVKEPRFGGRAPASPALVERPPLEPGFHHALRALGGILCRENFRDVVGFLAKVHFYRRANTADLFDWLVDAARCSRDDALVQQAHAFRRFCIEERAIGERFHFA